jgi:protein-S-isoprenylcysteine O-methyltransferase Ste14
MMILHVTHDERRSTLNLMAVNSTTQNNQQGASVRFPPPLAWAIALFAGVALSYVRGLELSFDRNMRIGAGVFVVILGVALIALARTHFVRTGQEPAPWKPSPELIVQGPYRFTRNPMYVGMTLITVGLGIALNNLWISALAPVALFAVHMFAVLPEERYLTEKFGAPYVEYLKRVRRYL